MTSSSRKTVPALEFGWVLTVVLTSYLTLFGISDTPGVTLTTHAWLFPITFGVGCVLFELALYVVRKLWANRPVR